ncbi:MAG: hypothetical protein LAT53_04575 [Idiomarina sp.]|nr:hypothetical protein [Idiomarina sp.]
MDRLALITLSTLVITACGGGSSESTGNTGGNTGGGTTPTSFTVNATANAGGSISPSSRTVTSGNTTTFTVTPNSGFQIDEVTGCEGSLSGDTYTTGAITAACEVSATFIGNAGTLSFRVSDANVLQTFAQTFYRTNADLSPTAPSVGIQNQTQTSPPPPNSSNLIGTFSDDSSDFVIDFDGSVYVSEAVLTPDGKSIVVALSPYGDYEADYGRVIAENRCAVFLVDLATNAYRCAVQNMIMEPIDNSSLSLNARSIQFDDQRDEAGNWIGNMYFQGGSFTVSGDCEAHCGINYPGTYQLKKLTHNGDISNVTNDLQSLNGFYAGSSGSVLIYHYDNGINNYLLQLINQAGQVFTIHTGHVQQVLLDDMDTITFYQNSHVRFTKPRAAGGFYQTRLEQNHWLEKFILGANGNLYGLSSGELRSKLPYNETPLARFDNTSFFNNRSLQPQLTSQYLLYPERVTAPFYGEVSVIRGLNTETGAEFSLLDEDYETHRLTLMNWQVGDEQVVFAAVDLINNQAVIGELDLNGYFAGESINEYLKITPVTSASSAVAEVRDVLLISNREPEQDDGAAPVVTVSNDVLQGETITLRFSKSMNQQSVLDSLALLDETSGAEVEFIPVWFGRTLHLVPDLTGLQDSGKKTLSRTTQYSLQFSEDMLDSKGRALDFAGSEIAANGRYAVLSLGDHYFAIQNESDEYDVPAGSGPLITLYKPYGAGSAKIPADLDISADLQNFELSFTVPRWQHVEISLADNDKEWLKLSNESGHLSIFFWDSNGPRQYWYDFEHNNTNWLNLRLEKVDGEISVWVNAPGEEETLIKWYWYDTESTVTVLKDVQFAPADYADLGLYLGGRSIASVANLQFTDITNAASPRVIFNSNTMPINGQETYIPASFVKREPIEFMKVRVSVSAPSGHTEQRVQAVIGQMNRFYHGRNSGELVQASANSECELSVTPEYVEYLVPKTQSWRCSNLYVNISKPYAAQELEAYSADESLIVNFEDPGYGNTQEIVNTVVIAKSADITLSNYTADGNILITEASSPTEVTGLNNGTTYYVAVVTDFYGEVTLISDVVSATPYAPASDLRFHVQGAQSFILYDRPVAAFDTDTKASAAEEQGMGYWVDRSPKPTNLMKVTADGEVLPVIESRDSSYVYSFVVTPDQRWAIIALSNYNNNDYTIDNRTIIARNNCAIFKVDLETSEHSCFVEGWMPPGEHHPNSMALWGKRNPLSISTEIENGEWAGALYLEAYSFKESHCSDTSSQCWIEQGEYKKIIKVLDGDTTVVNSSQSFYVYGLQAIDKNYYAIQFWDQVRQDNRVQLRRDSEVQENASTPGNARIIVDKPGQYAILNAANNSFRIGNVNGWEVKRTSLAFGYEINELFTNEHGDLYAVNYGSIESILPRTNARKQLQLDDEFWSWYNRIYKNKPLILRGDSMFFVEEVEHVSFGSQDIIRRQSLAENTKDTVFQLPNGEVLTVLHWAEANGEITFVGRNESTQTSFVGKLDLDRVLAGESQATSFTQWPVPEHYNADARLVNVQPLRVNEPAEIAPALHVRLSDKHSLAQSTEVTIALRFNQPMNRESVMQAIELVEQSSGEAVQFVPYWLGNTLHIIPDRGDLDVYEGLPLANDVHYELRLQGEVSNASGTVLDWSNANVGPGNPLVIYNN